MLCVQGQPAYISFRNDDETARALEALEATERNRSAVIKAAIVAYAAAQANRNGSQDGALHRIRQDLDEINRRLGVVLGETA